MGHGDHQIGFSSFERLKPFFVKKCGDRNVCCCKYHVELDLLREGLNSMRNANKGLHASISYACDCPLCINASASACCASENSLKGVTMLWEQIVCPKVETAEFHKLECLMGLCGDYGADKLPLCPMERSNSTWTLR